MHLREIEVLTTPFFRNRSKISAGSGVYRALDFSVDHTASSPGGNAGVLLGPSRAGQVQYDGLQSFRCDHGCDPVESDCANPNRS
jgi:hypothetical protein